MTSNEFRLIALLMEALRVGRQAVNDMEIAIEAVKTGQILEKKVKIMIDAAELQKRTRECKKETEHVTKH